MFWELAISRGLMDLLSLSSILTLFPDSPVSTLLSSCNNVFLPPRNLHCMMLQKVAVEDLLGQLFSRGMILTICNFECLHKAVIYCIFIRARHIFRNIYFRKKPKAKRGVLKFAYQHISAYEAVSDQGLVWVQTTEWRRSSWPLWINLWHHIILTIVFIGHIAFRKNDMYVVKKDSLEDTWVLGQKVSHFFYHYCKFSWMTLANCSFSCSIHQLVEEFIL